MTSNFRPYIIAISSTTGTGSGKSSVARCILRLDRDARVFSFATPMKEMIITLLMQCGYSRDMAETYVYEPRMKDQVVPETGCTARHLMQKLGTEWRMMVNPDLWAQALIPKVRAALERGNNVVIDDLRYPEPEYSLLRASFAGRGVEVMRLNVDSPNGRLTGHSSEQAFVGLQPTFQINNTGTLDDLFRKVKILLAPA